jgi:hypothetical protein
VSVPEIALSVRGNGFCLIDGYAARGCALHMESAVTAPQAGTFMQILVYQRVSGGSMLSACLFVQRLRSGPCFHSLVSSTVRRRILWTHHRSDRLMFRPSSQFVYEAATHRLRRQFSMRSEDSTCHGSASATRSLPLRPRIKSDHDSTR